MVRPFPAAEPSAFFPLAQYLSTGAQIQDADGRPLLETTPLTELLSFFREAEAAGVMPFTTGFLIDINPTDPVVFGVTGLLLAGAALAACLGASRRAAKADLLAALNAD